MIRHIVQRRLTFSSLCLFNSSTRPNQSRNASFNPGGWLFAPNATSAYELLPQRPEWPFTADAPTPYIKGQRFSNSTFNAGSSTPTPFITLQIEITNPITDEVFVPCTDIPINSTGNEFSFSLSSFTPRQNPYPDVWCFSRWYSNFSNFHSAHRPT